jgi:type 1 glutamine amidotransferase
MKYVLRLVVMLLPMMGHGQLRVLIVDGVNNHDWQAGTKGIQDILKEKGGFTVEVNTVMAETLEKWNPGFAKYDVVINNFNGGHTEKGLAWPARVESALETYVRGGGGLVVYHAANNAFLNWAAYNDMIGLGWRDPSFGVGLAVAEDGSIVTIPKGSGLKPGHPPRHDFEVHVRDTGHPVTQGLPVKWMQPMEQLTHGQHGPAEGLTILTYAYSETSKQNEPMDWVRSYGKGRVYVTMLGHTWKNEANPNLDCKEFRQLFAQGVRWAATQSATTAPGK